MRILIVDDDEDQLAVRRLLLEHSGFDPIAACSCDSALRAAEAKTPDCALVDLSIPDEQSGFRLIRDLKRLHPAMHIWLLTGRAPRALQQFPEHALIDEVIVKGNSSTHLIRKLRSLASNIIKSPSVQ